MSALFFKTRVVALAHSLTDVLWILIVWDVCSSSSFILHMDAFPQECVRNVSDMLKRKDQVTIADMAHDTKHSVIL